MGIKFDSKVVEKAFKEICKAGGNKKEIDTNNEVKRLSEYLATNQDDMSPTDIATFNNCIQSFNTESQNNNTEQAVINNEKVHVEVQGSNNRTMINGNGNNNVFILGDMNINGSSQVAIGSDNEQNMGSNTNATPQSIPVTKQETKKSPVDTPNKVADKTPAKKTDYITDKGSVDKTDKPDYITDKTPAKKTNYITDKGSVDKTDKPDYITDKGSTDKTKKYDSVLWVDMMPARNCTKDINYIKSNVLTQLRNLPLSDIGKLETAITKAKTNEDIIAACQKHGIDVKFAY